MIDTILWCTEIHAVDAILVVEAIFPCFPLNGGVYTRGGRIVQCNVTSGCTTNGKHLTSRRVDHAAVRTTDNGDNDRHIRLMNGSEYCISGGWRYLDRLNGVPFRRSCQLCANLGEIAAEDGCPRDFLCFVFFGLYKEIRLRTRLLPMRISSPSCSVYGALIRVPGELTNVPLPLCKSSQHIVDPASFDTGMTTRCCRIMKHDRAGATPSEDNRITCWRDLFPCVCSGQYRELDHGRCPLCDQ